MGGQPANWKIVVDNYLEGYHVPIAHPGLMRLYDYKRYEGECHDGWAWFDAPLRDKPSSNRVERIYQRLAEPMPGLPDEHTRIWHYILIYPNTAIDLYPDQVGIWQIRPDGPLRTDDRGLTLLPRNASVRTRAAQYANRKINQLVAHEDFDLVENQQAGLATRGFQPGPLSRREAAVGLVRGQDPGRPRGGRLSRGGRAERTGDARERILAAAVERIASEGIDDMRIARVAMDAGVSTSLVHYHFATREALLEQALEYSYELAGDVRIGEGEDQVAGPRGAAGRADGPVPALPGAARARLDPLGRALAARRAPPRDAADGGAPLRAHARVARRSDRRGRGERGAARGRPRARWPTGCWRWRTATG